jgi:hypothetical protein
VSVGYTYLTVIDPKTGDNIWSDSKRLHWPAARLIAFEKSCDHARVVAVEGFCAVVNSASYPAVLTNEKTRSRRAGRGWARRERYSPIEQIDNG